MFTHLCSNHAPFVIRNLDTLYSDRHAFGSIGNDPDGRLEGLEKQYRRVEIEGHKPREIVTEPTLTLDDFGGSVL